MPPWESKIFPGTKRDWWVYVPAQYKPENPGGVMVFQDGARAEGLRADGVRQPDRQGRHSGDGGHLHPARVLALTAARTAASSTTRCPISMRGSCSRRSCRKWRRP